MIRSSLLLQVELEEEGKGNTNTLKVPISSPALCSISSAYRDPLLWWEPHQEPS